MEDQTAVQPPTIHGWLDHWARARPDSTFVRLGDSQFTFAHLAEDSRRCASALSRRGIVSGDRIALAVDNGVEWLTVFFSAMRLGAVIVTVNPVYRTEELNHILGVTEAKLVISHQRSGDFDLVEYYSGADLPSLETTVFLPDAESDGAGLLLFEDLLRDGRHDDPDVADRIDASAEDTALILFSSGTTGRSKGVVLTHETLIASATAQAEEFGQTEGDVVLGIMPLTHVGGITCTVISSLVKGGGIDMVPRFHPRVVADLLLDNRVTLMVGVPTMYAMLLADDRLADADLSAVRLCVIGGANVEPAAARHMAETFCSARLANLYGLSESSGACIISPEAVTMDGLSSSVGAPIGDFEARIVGSDGQAAPLGFEGELQIAGRCVMKEYWRLPEETDLTKTPDGWLNTGDIAVQHTDGTVSLRGRSKEMFIHGGYNVYPAEIENVISTLPGVEMVAVIGIPDAKYGDSGRAFVVRAAEASVTEDDIVGFCTDQLAEYKVPDSVVFVDALPLTPSGKIQKTKLAD
jgi:acyl-CoA synthetase (AMP-forming)/AMP-acid ligase II